MNHFDTATTMIRPILKQLNVIIQNIFTIMIYYTIVILLYVNCCVFKLFKNFNKSQKLNFHHDLDHELFILFQQKICYFLYFNLRIYLL